MIVDSYHDLKVFFLCMLCTAITGFVFDLFRALRRAMKTGAKMTAFEDALFCAVAFYLFTKTVDLSNNGELRWFEFAGMFFGISMYFLWVSKFALMFLTKIWTVIFKLLSVFRCFFQKVLHFVCTPFRKIFLWAKRHQDSLKFKRTKNCRKMCKKIVFWKKFF